MNGSDLMSVTEDLATPYHQQDTDYYCGAACAQMVLDSIGSGLVSQDQLYADNHNHSAVFSVDDRPTVARRVVGQRVEFPGRLGRILVRPEAVCWCGNLVVNLSLRFFLSIYLRSAIRVYMSGLMARFSRN
jgi:hypothetical protein